MIYLIVIVVLYLSICYFMFLFIFRNGMSKAFKIIDRKIDESLSPYKDIFDEGKKWIESQDIKKLTIKAYDNIDLNASFIKNKNEKYILILSHGYRSTPMRDLYASLKEYYKMGCSILLIDLRGCYNSEAKYITFGYKESKDIDKWVNYMYKHNKKTPIILGGVSLGASSILMVNNRHVKLMIADCGYSSAYNEIKYVIKHYFHLPSILFLPTVDLFFRLSNGISLKKINTFDNLSKINIPILFFHGLDDEFVRHTNTIENYNFYKGKKDILMVKGADHGISYLIDKERYINKIKNFIKKNI